MELLIFSILPIMIFLYLWFTKDMPNNPDDADGGWG